MDSIEHRPAGKFTCDPPAKLFEGSGVFDVEGFDQGKCLAGARRRVPYGLGTGIVGLALVLGAAWLLRRRVARTSLGTAVRGEWSGEDGADHGRPGDEPRAWWRPARTAKLLFVLAWVVTSATTLWARQTPDALLRASSFIGALLTAAFWLMPTIAVYCMAVRNQSMVVAWGCMVAVLEVWLWFGLATDRHSTAAIGPFLLGWIFLPICIATVAILRWTVKTGR